MSVYTKLAAVQRNLKAPKNLYNDYGKYNYRNAEGILEAVKPYEKEYEFCLILTDSLIQVGERYYIKTEAVFIDTESGENISVSAMAREPLSKKGMDESQITGCASSYARKYALNGLFLLDDTKDADSNEVERISRAHISNEQIKMLAGEMKRTGYTEEQIFSWKKISSYEDITADMFNHIMDTLKARKTV